MEPDMTRTRRLVVRKAEAENAYLDKSANQRTLLRFMIDNEIAGAESFALFVNQIDAGARDGGGLHTHESEHGFYILRGRARFRIGDEDFVVEAESSVFIPANVPHMVTNDGDQVLEYVVIYSPQGPERQQRIDLLGHPSRQA
jgi:mannose-6-phosphate isomerase-like protein (cupin superfamily)